MFVSCAQMKLNEMNPTNDAVSFNTICNKSNGSSEKTMEKSND